MSKGQARKRQGKTLSGARLIASDLLMIICACLLLYPIVSDVWNSQHDSKLVAQYQQDVAEMDQADLDAALAAAHEYNSELATRGASRFTMTDEERERYRSLLKIGTTDVMSYITCEKMGVDALPIYHGTTSEVLQVGVGHYEGSSLPVGGTSTHCVLSGHTGMANMKMFTELSKLELGDRFEITTLGQTLTYEVEEINQVVPSDLSHLNIEEGRDLCTLVTCIPIGINSERLLVRGHRVNVAEEDAGDEQASETIDATNPVAELVKKLLARFPTYELGMAGGGAAVLGLFVVPDCVRAAKRRCRGGSKRDEDESEDENEDVDENANKDAGEQERRLGRE